mmetsp:Transcript_6735/g.17596  ORF Transcript_6735/g.17596 Transcript_6735/m.17596 type:complete len:208 (+) Transcript_6735:238-861(+)
MRPCAGCHSRTAPSPPPVARRVRGPAFAKAAVVTRHIDSTEAFPCAAASAASRSTEVGERFERFAELSEIAPTDWSNCTLFNFEGAASFFILLGTEPSDSTSAREVPPPLAPPCNSGPPGAIVSRNAEAAANAARIPRLAGLLIATCTPLWPCSIRINTAPESKLNTSTVPSATPAATDAGGRNASDCTSFGTSLIERIGSTVFSPS